MTEFSGHWNTYQYVAVLAYQLVQTLPFPAKNDYSFFPVVDCVIRLPFLARLSHRPRTPAFLSVSRERLILAARTIGTYSSAPAADLPTVSVSPTARRSGMITASAPAAFAVRMMAPRL